MSHLWQFACIIEKNKLFVYTTLVISPTEFVPNNHFVIFFIYILRASKKCMKKTNLHEAKLTKKKLPSKWTGWSKRQGRPSSIRRKESYAYIASLNTLVSRYAHSQMSLPVVSMKAFWASCTSLQTISFSSKLSKEMKRIQQPQFY